MKEPVTQLRVSVSLHAQLQAIAEKRQMLLRDLTDTIMRDWLSLHRFRAGPDFRHVSADSDQIGDSKP